MAIKALTRDASLLPLSEVQARLVDPRVAPSERRVLELELKRRLRAQRRARAERG